MLAAFVPGLYGAKTVEVTLFPGPGPDCKTETRQWLQRHLGRDARQISCPEDPWTERFQKSSALSHAGPGVHPYLRARDEGRVELESAVTLIGVEPDTLRSVEVVADAERRPLRIGSAMVTHDQQNGFPRVLVSFRVPWDTLDAPFLEKLAAASKRLVVYRAVVNGKEKEKTLKISNRNAELIGHVLRLNEAIRSEKREGIP